MCRRFVFLPKILNKQKDNFRFLGNEDESIQRKPDHQSHQEEESLYHNPVES
jgi:hypothetical protein